MADEKPKEPKQLPLIRRKIRGKWTAAMHAHEAIVKQHIDKILAEQQGKKYVAPEPINFNVPKGADIVDVKQVEDHLKQKAFEEVMAKMKRLRGTRREEDED